MIFLSFSATFGQFKTLALMTRLVHQLGADGQRSLKPSGDQHNTDGWRFAHIHTLYTSQPRKGGERVVFHG